MKHTSGLWRVIRDDFNREGTGAWGSVVANTKRGLYYIATIETNPGFDINGKEVDPKENAAFIVKACNMHEELLKACVALYNAKGNSSRLEKALIKAEAVINKAEGRE